MDRRRFLTIGEIESYINTSSSEDEGEVVSAKRMKIVKPISKKITSVVYIPPADVDAVSDEELIDDNEMITEVPAMTDVCGELEVEHESDVEDFASPPSCLVGIPDDGPSCSAKTTRYTAEKDFGTPNWKKTKRIDFKFGPPDESGVESLKSNIVDSMSGKTPFELFLQFFDEEIMEMLVVNTNMYAHQNNIVVDISKQQIYRFIGILILSGYHKVPHVEHYWSTQQTLGIPIVKQALSRNNFQLIKRIFHLMDNYGIDATDRFAKVRPLIDALNRKYMQFGVFETFLSIDEQMIPYFGRHSCKMFIRNKPIRFGFKYWALCSDSGYLYAVAPYGGSSVPYDKNVGLGASVVLSLLENVRNADNHAIYFDNFFSSYYLFCLLSEKRFRATGTVRSNRLRGAEKLLSTGKKLKKHQYDYCSEINNKLFVARWQDNAEVTVISNFKSVDPLAVSQRWCKAEKKKVSVEQPGLIHDYNQHMGGVDLHDNAVANYRVGIRGKKWWWPLWTNSVNSTTVNAWKIHCLICKAEGTRHMSQISFKTEIAESLLLYCEEVSDEISDSSDIEEAERPVHLPRINVRDHVVWKPPGNKRKRCAMCHSQTVYECKKCNLRLHPKCFDEYHTDLGNKKK